MCDQLEAADGNLVLPSLGSKALVNGKHGVVKFAGFTTFATGPWVGVALEQPLGKNDGSVQGIRYFSCQAQHGIFVRPCAVQADPALAETRGWAPTELTLAGEGESCTPVTTACTQGSARLRQNSTPAALPAQGSARLRQNSTPEALPAQVVSVPPASTGDADSIRSAPPRRQSTGAAGFAAAAAAVRRPAAGLLGSGPAGQKERVVPQQRRSRSLGAIRKLEHPPATVGAATGSSSSIGAIRWRCASQAALQEIPEQIQEPSEQVFKQNEVAEKDTPGQLQESLKPPPFVQDEADVIFAEERLQKQVASRLQLQFDEGLRRAAAEVRRLVSEEMLKCRADAAEALHREADTVLGQAASLGREVIQNESTKMMEEATAMAREVIQHESTKIMEETTAMAREVAIEECKSKYDNHNCKEQARIGENHNEVHDWKVRELSRFKEDVAGMDDEADPELRKILQSGTSWCCNLAKTRSEGLQHCNDDADVETMSSGSMTSGIACVPKELMQDTIGQACSDVFREIKGTSNITEDCEHIPGHAPTTSDGEQDCWCHTAKSSQLGSASNPDAPPSNGVALVSDKVAKQVVTCCAQVDEGDIDKKWDESLRQWMGHKDNFSLTLLRSRKPFEFAYGAAAGSANSFHCGDNTRSLSASPVGTGLNVRDEAESEDGSNGSLDMHGQEVIQDTMGRAVSDVLIKSKENNITIEGCEHMPGHPLITSDGEKECWCHTAEPSQLESTSTPDGTPSGSVTLVSDKVVQQVFTFCAQVEEEDVDKTWNENPGQWMGRKSNRNRTLLRSQKPSGFIQGAAADFANSVHCGDHTRSLSLSPMGTDSNLWDEAESKDKSNGILDMHGQWVIRKDDQLLHVAPAGQCLYPQTRSPGCNDKEKPATEPQPADEQVCSRTETLIHSLSSMPEPKPYMYGLTSSECGALIMQNMSPQHPASSDQEELHHKSSGEPEFGYMQCNSPLDPHEASHFLGIVSIQEGSKIIEFHQDEEVKLAKRIQKCEQTNASSSEEKDNSLSPRGNTDKTDEQNAASLNKFGLSATYPQLLQQALAVKRHCDRMPPQNQNISDDTDDEEHDATSKGAPQDNDLCFQDSSSASKLTDICANGKQSGACDSERFNAPKNNDFVLPVESTTHVSVVDKASGQSRSPHHTTSSQSVLTNLRANMLAAERDSSSQSDAVCRRICFDAEDLIRTPMKLNRNTDDTSYISGSTAHSPYDEGCDTTGSHVSEGMFSRADESDLSVGGVDTFFKWNPKPSPPVSTVQGRGTPLDMTNAGSPSTPALERQPHQGRVYDRRTHDQKAENDNENPLEAFLLDGALEHQAHTGTTAPTLNASMDGRDPWLHTVREPPRPLQCPPVSRLPSTSACLLSPGEHTTNNSSSARSVTSSPPGNIWARLEGLIARVSDGPVLPSEDELQSELKQWRCEGTLATDSDTS